MKNGELKLTFGNFNKSKGAILKCINCAVLENFEDAIALGELKESVDKMLELDNKGKNTIVFKYAKKKEAEDRISEDEPLGYLDAQEQEDQLEENKKHLDKECSVVFNFPVLTKESVNILFKGYTEKKEKSNNLTPYELKALKELGMLPGKKAEKVEEK